MGVSRGQLIKLERGERRLTADYIHVAARAFGVPESAVIGSEHAVPVVGLVGAGGSISTEHENDRFEPLFSIDLPISFNEDVIAFQVAGDSMFPAYHDGDVIVVSRAGAPVDTLLGLEAVVKVNGSDEPGDRYFKKLIRGANPTTFDLESYNAPTMRGVRISWASAIIVRVPKSQFQRRNGAGAKKPAPRRRAKKD